MKYSFFIGRYQPLHEGHIKLIRTVLDEGKSVLIGFRNTGVDKSNPYSINERMGMFRKEFTDEVADGQMIFIALPDIESVCYGRKVGYGIRQIDLDDETESISGTKIRGKQYRKLGYYYVRRTP
jgi:cytidyltransferase-like protein|tara:strand:+ start:32 stop:403 length:372 start_codon:yes stop_codon:yes gene_type:complete